MRVLHKNNYKIHPGGFHALRLNQQNKPFFFTRQSLTNKNQSLTSSSVPCFSAPPPLSPFLYPEGSRIVSVSFPLPEGRSKGDIREAQGRMIGEK